MRLSGQFVAIGIVKGNVPAKLVDHNIRASPASLEVLFHEIAWRKRVDMVVVEIAPSTSDLSGVRAKSHVLIQVGSNLVGEAPLERTGDDFAQPIPSWDGKTGRQLQKG